MRTRKLRIRIGFGMDYSSGATALHTVVLNGELNAVLVVIAGNRHLGNFQEEIQLSVFHQENISNSYGIAHFNGGTIFVYQGNLLGILHRVEVIDRELNAGFADY